MNYYLPHCVTKVSDSTGVPGKHKPIHTLFPDIIYYHFVLILLYTCQYLATNTIDAIDYKTKKNFIAPRER